MNGTELLAPAGNLTTLKAAVENGADAVYIGGTQFSARQKAENFTYEQMQEGIAYAHERGRKVHVTVNTMLRNDEIGDLVEYIYQLAELKVDAVIAQDLGAIHLLQETMPQIPVHASTQMTIHNTEGARFWKEQGLDRVVLARETSLQTIREIHNNVDIELESFVHGALCVSYSGQCLLSSMIGGRSGNRGLCAQPCRMPYQLLDGTGKQYETKGKYLLSTRDLNMLHHVPDLINSGITSFKIEGRMKRPEYVAVVVRAYREAIDAYYQSEKLNFKQRDKEILQIFNRDFTTGYYYGNPGGNLMSHSRPDNRGIKIGDVLKTEKNKTWIQLQDNLSVGDGYLLINKKGEEIAGKVHELSIRGKNIESAKAGQIVQMPVSGNADGATVCFRTSDSRLLKEAEATYKQPSVPNKSRIHFKLDILLGQPISLLAWDDKDHYFETKSEYLVELAKTSPSTVEGVTNQMNRLGNTPFELGDIAVNLDDGVIAPSSELNKLRREATEALESLLQEETEDIIPDYEDYLDDAGDLLDRIPPQVNGYGLRQRLAVTVGSEEGFQAALDSGADLIYIQSTPLRRGSVISEERYEELANICHEKGVQLYWTCSPIQNNRQMEHVKKQMMSAKEVGFDGVLAGNFGILQMAKEMGWDSISADYTLNIANDVSLQFLSNQEIGKVTLSPELSLAQISDISYLGNLPLEMIVHGNIPLMTSEQCVAGSVLGGRTENTSCSMPCMKQQYFLQDRTQAQFPLYMDVNCRMHVMNSKMLNLYKRMDECLPVGVDFIRIEAREQSGGWIRSVVSAYRRLLDEYNDNGKILISVTDEELLNRLAPNGSTYGHTFRGVQ